MASKRGKISKHGTLGEGDLSDAVPIDLGKVLESTKSPSTKHLFGGAGDLPPRSAQEVERRYVDFWKIVDPENIDIDWVGLTVATNEKKGVFTIDLVPGEYRLELKLPKDLNRNVLGSFTGAIVGGIKSLTLDGEEAEEAMQRGIPNMYADINICVQAPRYAILDITSVMDLGVHDSFTQIFSVKEVDMPAKLKIRAESHTTMKRLKLQGILKRRDFAQSKRASVTAPPAVGVNKGISAKKLSEEGKQLIKEAYKTATDEDTSLSRKKLHPSVDPKTFLINFYATYAPSKISDVDKVVTHFKGRTDDLLETLEEKYDVKFDIYGNVIQN